jgi:hypothetical protein
MPLFTNFLHLNLPEDRSPFPNKRVEIRRLLWLTVMRHQTWKVLNRI